MADADMTARPADEFARTVCNRVADLMDEVLKAIRVYRECARIDSVLRRRQIEFKLYTVYGYSLCASATCANGVTIKHRCEAFDTAARKIIEQLDGVPQA